MERQEQDRTREAGGTVVVYVCGDGGLADRYDAATRTEAARRLAGVGGFAFEGEHDPARAYSGPLYFEPSDTLLGTEARALGIVGPDDLFGGVVPRPFVATKAIAHPLVAEDAGAPPGWAHAFARHMEGSVVAGFTVFTRADARRAALRLLDKDRGRGRAGVAGGARAGGAARRRSPPSPR